MATSEQLLQAYYESKSNMPKPQNTTPATSDESLIKKIGKDVLVSGVVNPAHRMGTLGEQLGQKVQDLSSSALKLGANFVGLPAKKENFNTGSRTSQLESLSGAGGLQEQQFNAIKAMPDGAAKRKALIELGKQTAQASAENARNTEQLGAVDKSYDLPFNLGTQTEKAYTGDFGTEFKRSLSETAKTASNYVGYETLGTGVNASIPFLKGATGKATELGAEKTGGFFANLVKNAPTGVKMVKEGAITGGTQAFGDALSQDYKSFPDLLKNVATQTMFGSVAGGATAGALYGAGRVVGGVGNKILGKGSKTAGSVAEEAATGVTKDNLAQKTAKYVYAQQFGLNPDTISTVVEETMKNPETFTQAGREAFRRNNIGRQFGEVLNQRLSDLENFGEAYKPVRDYARKTNTLVEVPDGFITKSFRSLGLSINPEGKLVRTSVTEPLKASEIAQLQQFMNFYNKPALSIDEYFAARHMLKDIANNFEGKNSSYFTKLGERMYGEFTDFASNVKGLKQLDAKYGEEATILKDFKRYINPETGGLSDYGRSQLANAGNVNNVDRMARIEKVFPGISQKLKIMKAVEDIDLATGQKVGTYNRIVSSVVGTSVGTIFGGPVGAVIGAFAGLAASNPEVGVWILMKYAKFMSKGMQETAEKVISKMVNGEPVTQAEARVFPIALKHAEQDFLNRPPQLPSPQGELGLPSGVVEGDGFTMTSPNKLQTAENGLTNLATPEGKPDPKASILDKQRKSYSSIREAEQQQADIAETMLKERQQRIRNSNPGKEIPNWDKKAEAKAIKDKKLADKIAKQEQKEQARMLKELEKESRNYKGAEYNRIRSKMNSIFGNVKNIPEDYEALSKGTPAQRRLAKDIENYAWNNDAYNNDVYSELLDERSIGTKGGSVQRKSSSNYALLGAGAGGAGIERDENGNIKINPKQALVGAVLGATGVRSLKNGGVKIGGKVFKEITELEKSNLLKLAKYITESDTIDNALENQLTKTLQKYGINQDAPNSKIVEYLEKLMEGTKTKGSKSMERKVLPSLSPDSISNMKKYSSAKDYADAEYKKRNEFRDGHRAPSYESTPVETRMNDGGSFNLLEVINGQHTAPEDYFDPKVGARYYGYTDKAGQESYRTIKRLMDNPEEDVVVYRTVPKDLKATKIEDGDWITFSKTYAKQHGESRFDGDYKIITQKANPKDVWWDVNDINEWGYDSNSKYTKDIEDWNQYKRESKNPNLSNTEKSEDADKSLVLIHNLSEENYLHSKKIGGLPNPSNAIVDLDKGMGESENFGNITLVGDKSMIFSKDARTFGGDVYSPRFPIDAPNSHLLSAEQASEKMNWKDTRGGDPYDSGDVRVRAQAIPEYFDINEIRKNKSKLSTVHQSSRAMTLSAVEFEDIANEAGDLMKREVGSEGERYDIAVRAISEYARTRDEKELQSRLMYNLTPEVTAKIDKFIKNIENSPSPYFETKINRVVQPSEYKYALVPDEVSDEVLAKLKKDNIKIVKYKNGDESDRLAKLKNLRSLMAFSLVAGVLTSKNKK